MGMEDYRRVNRKGMAVIIGLFLVAIAVAVYSISVSKYSISFIEAMGLVWDNLHGVEFENYQDRLKSFLVWDGYVPMAIAGVLVGAILGMGGSVMQNIVRNPVADSYTTGISSGALFGVTIFIVLGSGFTGLGYDIGLLINAFLFSLVPVAIIVVFSIFKKVTPTVMILIGIAVMYIFSAMTTLLKYTASEDDIASIYAWSVGTLGNVTWNSIPYLVFAFLFLFLVMMFMSNKLNVLITGENPTRTLGENPTRIRIVCLVVVSLATSVAVCFTGTIGFVGLVAPHIARILVGSNSKYLIPCSGAVGGLLLIFSDSVARMLGPTGMSVGVVTALFGGPLFLLFLFKQRKDTW